MITPTGCTLARIMKTENLMIKPLKQLSEFVIDRPKIISLFSVVVFLIIWEIVGRMTNPVLFAPPSAIVLSYPELILSGELPRGLTITLSAMISGYVIASVFGIIAGLLWGRSAILQDVVEPYINALYALPRVAVVPLVIIWIGIGFWGRIFIIFYGTVFDTMINTYTGVRYTDQTLLEVGKSFGANEKQLFRHIIIPYSLPYIMAGLRLGIGRALVGVIVAEMFLQMTGMGGIILILGEKHRIAGVLAVVIILSMLGIFFTGLVKRAEHMVAPWKDYEGVTE